MRTLAVPTRRGPAIFDYWPKAFTSDRPLAVLFHGSFRGAEHNYTWRERLSDLEVIFARLPGYAAPAFDQWGIVPWAEAYAEAVVKLPKRPSLAIGESIGALISLALPVDHVVAIEPFLDPAKAWPIQDNLRQAAARGFEPYRPFVQAMFESGGHHLILDRIVAPTLVLAGSEPLMPERRVERPPSLLDDSDLAAFAAHPLVTTKRIEGGHALLEDNPDACEAEIRALIEQVCS